MLEEDSGRFHGQFRDERKVLSKLQRLRNPGGAGFQEPSASPIARFEFSWQRRRPPPDSPSTRRELSWQLSRSTHSVFHRFRRTFEDFFVSVLAREASAAQYIALQIGFMLVDSAIVALVPSHMLRC